MTSRKDKETRKQEDAASLLVSPTSCLPLSPSPDIIFIVLDTQRADRLGAYGYEKAITPNFDQFAAQGALFKMGITPAQWTVPSHASMFTGLYPTAHQMTQSNQALSKEEPTLVEWLQRDGYETVGFCNNPIVGVLDNGFKRGFDAFYNYCGAAPNPYKRFANLPAPAQTILNAIANAFRRFADPIQNFFGQSEQAFSISINEWLTPIWARLANFKGQNERSVRHIAQLLQDREQANVDKPLFLFLNLMETHLPFWPPQTYLDQTAPYLREDATMRAEMQRWNREAYRWAAPLAEPMPESERRLLSDLYDAEVAYQDAYLGELFTALAKRDKANNTLTIIVGDHGDGLGEHQMVGHAFNAYQELVHVPLVVHWPEQIESNTVVAEPVSTRRVFHTMVEAAGVDWTVGRNSAELSLLQTIAGNDPENATAYSEIYPPLNFVTALQHRQPELLEHFLCTSLRRAIVQQNWKLIHVDTTPDEHFNLAADPLETDNLLGSQPMETTTTALDLQLNNFVETVDRQRASLAAGEPFDLQDERILQQLRGLGYIE